MYSTKLASFMDLKVLFFIILFALSSTLLAQSEKPYVIMLSMDGFRWDYPDKCATPNLDKIAEHGVKAASLQPSFPSKTFPNHYTIATGLYPDHHGIVGNSFYDPASGKHYSIGNLEAEMDSSFYGGEPIWVTAEKNSIRSATLFWVGSTAAIEGIRPTYWKKYDNSLTYSARIDTVLYWLSLPEEKRPHLVLMYMEEPDHTGHDEGPDGKGTLKTVESLDSLLGVFREKLDKLPIARQINFIVLSDHGMENISPDRYIKLGDYLNKEWFTENEGNSPILTLQVKKEFYDQAWEAMSAIPHITAWKHGQVLDSLHFGTNPRTLDFIVLADSSWSVTASGRISSMMGNHGWNPYQKDMQAIFYAEGPAFKAGYKSPTFENVNIYPLICHILGIQPAPADGKLENVKGMLKD
jgi:predicted AlkP superfamily pyrophosphatase or phosphodiesterase